MTAEFFDDLLQRAEQHSLRSVKIRDDGSSLVGALIFAGSLSARQIKGVLRQISTSPGHNLDSSVALPEKYDSSFQPQSCQVTVEERIQLFGFKGL